MSIHSNNSLEFQEFNLSNKPFIGLYTDFVDHDDLQIERQMWEFESEKKYNLDLASSTEYQQHFDSIDIHLEKMTSQIEQKQQDPCSTVEAKKKKYIKKSNKKENNRKKKDYKKNICGYITKTTVKESFSKEIRPIVEYICDAFEIKYMDFFIAYEDYSFITGPTHLDILLTPKLKNVDKEQSRYEILLRIVFIVYYRWFAKNRYLRYMMVEGKMERKGEYINYLNKIILPILANEQDQLLMQFAQIYGNYKINGKLLPDHIEHVYGSLIKMDSIKIEENEPKFRNHSQKSQISFNNPPEAFSGADEMQQKYQDLFSLDLESFML